MYVTNGDYERIKSVASRNCISKSFRKSGIVSCPVCCNPPVWDLWRVDTTLGQEVKKYDYLWSLGCSGALHCFGVSYSTDLVKVINSWNSTAQLYCDSTHIDIERVPEKNLTIFNVEGYLVFEDFMVVYKDFYDQNPTKNVMLDLTLADLTLIKSDHVRHIAKVLKVKFEKRPKGSQTAFITIKDLNYGLARMFQNLADAKQVDLDIEIFETRALAMDWLDA